MTGQENTAKRQCVHGVPLGPGQSCADCDAYIAGLPPLRRQAWVVVYERHGENMPTRREVYWSQAIAEERAAALAPECREILVGLMAWFKDPKAVA